MARQMQAVVMTAIGGPEVLELRQVRCLAARRDRRARAAEGGEPQSRRHLFPDLWPVHQERGAASSAMTAPAWWKRSAGDVTRFRPGDRVCFCNGGIGGDPGTYAEFAVVPEEQLVLVPANVDWIAGGGSAAGDDHGVGGAL